MRAAAPRSSPLAHAARAARAARPGGAAAEGPEPALRVLGLGRRIGSQPILAEVTFEVPRGELVMLVGPSGAGKSTLLRLVAGLDPSSTGRILLEGRDVTSVPVERRRIGLVFQDHALFPHRRVDQNIAFGLKHLDRAARRRRVAEILDLVRLPQMGNRYPHELSGGEQQRIALGRALAPDPAVVLLDEPFANLDESLRAEVRDDVIAALRRRGATAILVTHERDEALGFGDRVAVMREGRLLQLDRPEAVFERPTDRFVGSFLGEASFLPCDGAELGRCASGGGGGCVVMVRPHDLALRAGGDATVTGRQYLGAAWRYEVRLPAGHEVKVDGHAGARFEVGDTCTVSVVADHPLHHLPAR